MILKLKINPTIVKAATKEALVSKITNGYILTSTSNRNGFSVWGYSSFNGNTFIMYNLHKVRAKSVRIKRNGKQLNDSTKGKEKRTINENTKQGYWIAYVYTFDRNVIETFRLVLNQNTRNFTMTSR
jgi:hypothetical protein